MVRCLPAIALCGLALVGHPNATATAQQPGPASPTSIFVEPTVGATLDILESRINDVISHARQSGEYLLWRAGEAARQALVAWKDVNSDLLKKANDVLSEQQRQFLNSIDLGLRELRAEAADVDRRARDLTVMWAETVSSLPFPGNDAKIYFMSPQTIFPVGDTIKLTLKGPKLAKANVRVFIGNKEFKVTASTDFAVTTTIPRSEFPFDDTDDAFAQVDVVFDGNPGGILSKGQQKRSFDVWLLPSQLGTATVTEVIQRSNKVAAYFDTQAQASGRDVLIPVGVSIFPHLSNDGWKIDTSQIAAAGGVQVISAAGESGSCNGVSLSNMSETGLVYNIHISHSWRRGRTRGGWQICNIRVPIYKTISTVERKLAPPIRLSWLEDRTFRLASPENKAEVRVSLFNDRVYENVDATTFLAYLRVSRNGDTLLFNPRPPADF